MQSHIKRILISAFAVAALGAGVAHGKECKGVNFPDQAQVEGSNLTLNGLGLRQATFQGQCLRCRALRREDIERPERDAGIEYPERT